MLTQTASHKAFAGTVIIAEHPSQVTATTMTFAVFLPPTPPAKTLLWLSGLTCTHENFITKGHALKMAAAKGIALVVCDTSPRGTNHPGEHDSWDFGSGAGFYLDATQEPWCRNYRMASYLTEELLPLVAAEWGLKGPYGISGHSMGGHGALTLGLKHPELFASISAFAPICAPSQTPWGQKAFHGYLGADEEAWAAYDATKILTKRGGYPKPILIDQGTSDTAWHQQLQPELFQEACRQTGTELRLNFREGYDHGYYFVASFMEEHLQFHGDAG